MNILIVHYHCSLPMFITIVHYQCSLPMFITNLHGQERCRRERRRKKWDNRSTGGTPLWFHLHCVCLFSFYVFSGDIFLGEVRISRGVRPPLRLLHFFSRLFRREMSPEKTRKEKRQTQWSSNLPWDPSNVNYPCPFVRIITNVLLWSEAGQQ